MARPMVDSVIHVRSVVAAFRARGELVEAVSDVVRELAEDDVNVAIEVGRIGSVVHEAAPGPHRFQSRHFSNQGCELV